MPRCKPHILQGMCSCDFSEVNDDNGSTIIGRNEAYDETKSEKLLLSFFFVKNDQTSIIKCLYHLFNFYSFNFAFVYAHVRLLFSIKHVPYFGDL